VALQADLSYITNDEQEKKGSQPKASAQEKEAGVKKEGSDITLER
jgi:hypothetical protein